MALRGDRADYGRCATDVFRAHGDQAIADSPADCPSDRRSPGPYPARERAAEPVTEESSVTAPSAEGLREQLEEAHRAMCSIRAFELVVADAVRDGRLQGLLHLCIGAEAVITGVTSRLGPHDRAYSSHRPHGHFLALTGGRRELLAELAGRDTGLCRGRGGSMHLMDERAVMATGVVGGTLPIAVGHALTLEPDAVVVCFSEMARFRPAFFTSR